MKGVEEEFLLEVDLQGCCCCDDYVDNDDDDDRNDNDRDNTSNKNNDIPVDENCDNND